LASEDVTRLLNQAGSGDAGALDQLLEQVYGELRRMAGAKMRSERQDHTLQPTALVNEAYMRLVQGEPTWENRAHFFGAASEAMRRILVDHARKHAAEKRGGDATRVTFSDLNVQAESGDVNLLALDEALNALTKMDERLGLVVRLRYFAGLSIPETAKIMNSSPATVKRDWNYARAWLFEQMMK
jgi:RNA polymerase sigma-70 factor (ECF subfamily)